MLYIYIFILYIYLYLQRTNCISDQIDQSTSEAVAVGQYYADVVPLEDHGRHGLVISCSPTPVAQARESPSLLSMASTSWCHEPKVSTMTRHLSPYLGRESIP